MKIIVLGDPFLGIICVSTYSDHIKFVRYKQAPLFVPQPYLELLTYKHIFHRRYVRSWYLHIKGQIPSSNIP